MKSGTLVLTFLLFIIFSINGQELVKKKVLLMGTDFEICAIHENAQTAKTGIEKAVNEIIRIEELISSHKSTSQTSLVNKMAGISPVKVSAELFYLVERALKISQLTDGAFDISFAVTDNMWDFKSGTKNIPDKSSAQELSELIDYKNIILNQEDTTIFLLKKGMRIGFGAIGKGYAANMGKRILESLNISDGYIDASGDILFFGTNLGHSWKVGISSPEDRLKPFGWMDVTDMAVVTSGDYVYHIQTETENLSHIIDPKTAWPISSMRSVTIICPDAELADGLATSVSVLGAEIGLDLINKLKGVECILITSDGKLLTSANVKLNRY
jgi:FAD:protein FMN transferase